MYILLIMNSKCNPLLYGTSLCCCKRPPRLWAVVVIRVVVGFVAVGGLAVALIECFLIIAQWVQKWSLNARAQAIRLDPFDTLRRIPTIHFRFLRYFYRSYIIDERQFVVSIFSQGC